MTDNERDTFGIIAGWLRVSDPVWWTRILLIEKLHARGHTGYDGAWDDHLDGYFTPDELTTERGDQDRDVLHDAGYDDSPECW